LAQGEGFALRIEDLHVHYGPSHVLHGVNVEIPAGSVTAIVGRNGVGKSTLINTIMGLLPPTSGHVYCGDKDLLTLPADRRKQHGLALVPQGRRLFKSLTVEEHLRLVPPIRSGPFTFETILQLFPRLRDRLGASAQTLSGGERSMLSIARALVLNPAVLLMDEPTEGLAPLLVEAIRDIIPRMQQEGLTVLLVEQKLAFALAVADSLAVMERGVIHQEFARDQIRDVSKLSELILRGAGVEDRAANAPDQPGSARLS